MRVVCIRNYIYDKDGLANEINLTVGGIYKVNDRYGPALKSSEYDWLYITCDDGKDLFLPLNIFEEISKYRGRIIDEIIE